LKSQNSKVLVFVSSVVHTCLPPKSLSVVLGPLFVILSSLF